MDNCNEIHLNKDNDQIKQKMQHIKHKIVVMSGKGGVGKTTVAVNLAYSFAQSGAKVGIFDIDIHGPNIAKMLGVENCMIKNGKNGIEPVEVTENLKAISLALIGNGPDVPIIWRGPLKTGIIKQFLGETNWGNLDYLIIDSPPGTGDELLTVCQTIPDISGAIIVTTPQDVAILDARKTVLFARELKIPVIGIIENMSGFICPHCNKEIDIFKKGGGETASKELEVSFLGRIPFDSVMVELGDKGTPFISCKQDSNSSKGFQNIVTLINDTLSKNYPSKYI